MQSFMNHNGRCFILSFYIQISCACKNTCQRAGKCPCKTAKRQCTARCKCGTKRQPCKNRISHQLPQLPSLVEQFSEVEVRNSSQLLVV